MSCWPTRPGRRSRSPTTGSPSATVSSRRSRRSTAVPFALTRHLERLERERGRPGAAGARPRRRTTRASRPCSTARRTDPLGRLRITYTGGPAPMGSGRGDGTADAGRGRGADGPRGPPTTAVATVPWPRNERGAHGRAQDHVVRRERGRAGARPAERGGDRGGLRQPGRAPLRGHRDPTSSTSSTASCARRPWRAAAWPASPARWSWSGAAAAEVDEPIDGGRGHARARCSWSRPRATSRPSPAGTTATCPRPGP